jgi:hypothetical protein
MVTKVIENKVSPEREQISVYLPPKMALQVKMISAVDGVSMSQAVIDLVKEGLKASDLKYYAREFVKLDDADDDDKKESDQDDEE